MHLNYLLTSISIQLCLSNSSSHNTSMALSRVTAKVINTRQVEIGCQGMDN